MKKLLFTSLFLFSMPSCFSQNVLELEYLNQYTPNQIYWLTKKDIDIFAYFGNNAQVNFNLDLAIHHHKRANKYLLCSGMGVLLSTISMVITASRIRNNFNPFALESFLGFYVSTFMFNISFWTGLIGGVINSSYAKKKIKRARLLLSNLN